jgi:hypothetical protein
LRDVVEKFKTSDTADFPDFYTYETPLERGLWILWIAKKKLGIEKLDAETIVSVIRSVKEISIDTKSIVNAFNRSGDKVHTYHENSNTLFEIMKPGMEYLLSKIKEGSMQLFYFEPGKRFSSKRVLARSILANLPGDLSIVDPYCGERTLDILKDIKDRDVRVLTRIKNLEDKARQRFLRELEDFKSENQNIETRDYPYADIHDRYIISSDFLVILGHSIKDLGNKESFAILLDKNASKNIVEALIENFERRWKESKTI